MTARSLTSEARPDGVAAADLVAAARSGSETAVR